MALDHDGLFKVIGKPVKAINTIAGYITALNTLENEYFVVLEEEGLQAYYARPTSIPDEFDGFQTQISNWISQLIVNVRDVLQDRDYVVDQLNLFQYGVTDILNALFDYMTIENETIQSTVITLGGADADRAISANVDIAGDAVDATNRSYPRLFAFRLLDGVSSPGANLAANNRYANIESQLAMSATIYAELLTNTLGSETAQLFSGVSAVTPYGILTENPGNGPLLTNPEASNEISTNHDFSEWAVNQPTGWSMSGTITTDYLDSSGSGNGPLRINTAGITGTQKLTGLVHNTRYFMGMTITGNATMVSSDTYKLRLRNLAGTALSTVFSGTVADLEYNLIYGDFLLTESVDLTDVYIEIEYDAKGDAGNYGLIEKVVVAPVEYWNGLGWIWWPPYHISSLSSFAPVGHQTSLAISNNNAGVFQTFFRRAYGIQLPFADSPSIADTLAT